MHSGEGHDNLFLILFYSVSLVLLHCTCFLVILKKLSSVLCIYSLLLHNVGTVREVQCLRSASRSEIVAHYLHFWLGIRFVCRFWGFLLPIAFLGRKAGRKYFLVHSLKPVIMPQFWHLSQWWLLGICIFPGSEQDTFKILKDTTSLT